MSYWGAMARRHWQQFLPKRYAALKNPDRYFQLLDEHASSYYRSIRDSLLEGVSPNNGTIGWMSSSPASIKLTAPHTRSSATS